MKPARITKLGVRNFKSFGPQWQEIDFRLLTILIGRNSSGKSSLMQALLLLKQTLEHNRPEVQLRLEGPYVEALSLRELAHGWPEKVSDDRWPEFRITWSDEFKKHSYRPGSYSYLSYESYEADRETTLSVHFFESKQRIFADRLTLTGWYSEPSKNDRKQLPAVSIRRTRSPGTYKRSAPPGLEEVPFERNALSHFIPIFGKRNDYDDDERSPPTGYIQPLQQLQELLKGIHYLGATRTIGPSVYKAASSPLDDVGVSGEYAAQLLHQRQRDNVNLPPLVKLEDQRSLVLPDKVERIPLLTAVNQVMSDLGIRARFSLRDVQEVGFRLFCGSASIQHVGRGVGYLLPVVIAGLISDIHRGDDRSQIMPPLLMEEVDMHTHPKVQSQLAHFFVSLARAGRQMMVETHSDHMVRRLRRLIAQAAPGSEAERWLRENVNLVLVEQDAAGVTHIKQSSLQPGGEIGETWPADFLDEAPDEERAIYFAAADKTALSAEERPAVHPEVDHDPPTGDDEEDTEAPR